MYFFGGGGGSLFLLLFENVQEQNKNKEWKSTFYDLIIGWLLR